MKKGFFRTALLHGFLLLPSLAPGLGAVSLEEALSRLDRTSGVRLALLAVQSAEKNLQSLRFAGDPTFSLGPQVKGTSREWEPFAEQVALSAEATANIPLGLSAAEKERVRAAADAVTAARIRAGLARAQAYLEVYRLYQAAWLAAEEPGVLAAEQSAARAYAEALNERFRAGEVSLVELAEAEEDLNRSEAAVLEGNLQQRLSWLELAFAVEWELTQETPPVLPGTQPVPTAALPRPPELVAWALARDPESSALQAELVRIEETLARLRKSDLSVSLRGFGSVAEHVLSLGYAFTDPLLSASYTIPLYILGDIPDSGGSVPTWNLGVSVELSYTANKADRLAVQSLEVSREQLGSQLALRRQGLELGIRGQYLEWLKAKQALEQARRSLQRAEDNLRLLESKRRLGLVNEYDLLAGEALRKRAQWSVLAAESEQRTRLLSAAVSAAYLENIVGEIGAKQ